MKHRAIAILAAVCASALTVVTLPANADYIGIEWAGLDQGQPSGILVLA